MGVFPKIGNEANRAQMMAAQSLNIGLNQWFAGDSQAEMFDLSSEAARRGANMQRVLGEYNAQQQLTYAKDQEEITLSKGNRFLSSIHANLAASGIQADSGSAADFISSQNKKIFEDVAAIRREGRDKAQMARFNAEMAAYQSDTLADIRSYKAGQSREVAVYEIGDTILGTKYEMKRLGILGDLFEGGIFA